MEERFTEPKGWRWHHFTRDGRKIRFGSIFPADSIPDAVVVCLPGLGEYAEKYFEVARDINNRNMAFWIIDWYGQGDSGRYIKNSNARHSNGFEEDIKDLHYFIMEYIKHSSVHPDKGRIPLAMLAHSMGANIGLDFLVKYPGMFECAALTAPLLGVYQFKKYPAFALSLLAKTLNIFAPKSYAFGQSDWSPNMRPTPGYDEYSSDEKRGALHCYWWDQNPNLRMSGVTFGWVYNALKSARKLKKSASDIETEILIGIAGDERVVDNTAIENFAKKLKNKKLLHLEKSKHEILMETDDVRDTFLDGFQDLVHRTIISRPETLKKF